MNNHLDRTVRRFAQFLNASWEMANATVATPNNDKATNLVSDWAQANWEILVEAPLRKTSNFRQAYLEPYGDGADCNDSSSRVWNPHALPTHRIVCRGLNKPLILDLLSGRTIDTTRDPVIFDHFATKSARNWHEETPPFDCVLGYQADREVLLRLNDVSFIAEAVHDTHNFPLA